MLGCVLLVLAAAAPPAVSQPGADAIASTLAAHVRIARDAYARAALETEGLGSAVHAFLDRPSEATLETARASWIAARDPYGRTEVFRFSGGPIDDVHPVTGEDGPEGRINAWPVDEAYLDAVAGSPRGGLIGDLSVPIDETSLLGRNAAEDETQVTLGFHAIEFLLWGQDGRRDGPGARPAADYRRGDPIRERRRACLALVTDLLIRDLRWVATQWEPGPGRYADAFLALRTGEALGRVLSGAATLAGFELGSERIGVPLSSGEQEDEHSCFSDNTHRDLAANVEGLALVLEGDGSNPGLLRALPAADRDDIRDRLERVRAGAYAIDPPFDAILAAPADHPRRRALQALAGELIGLAGAIQRAGATAGVRVVIGGGG